MNPAQQEALRYALMTGLASGGLGAGMALMSHMHNAASRPALEDLATLAPETINIPYPKKKKKPGELGQKAANWLTGSTSDNWWEVPLAPIGIMGAGIAGGVGAHSLMKDYLIKRRKRKMQQQVESAEDDYRNALLGAYDKENLDIEKKSAIKEINEGLEKLASILKVSGGLDLSKVPVSTSGQNVFQSALDASSNAYQSLKNKLGPATGGPKAVANVLGGLALLSAAGIPTLTGIAAYKYFKGRDKSKMLNEAAKERQYARLTENVPEMYAGVEA